MGQVTYTKIRISTHSDNSIPVEMTVLRIYDIQMSAKMVCHYTVGQIPEMLKYTDHYRRKTQGQRLLICCWCTSLGYISSCLLLPCNIGIANSPIPVNDQHFPAVLGLYHYAAYMIVLLTKLTTIMNAQLGIIANPKST